ncbi:hypothetical protein PMG11_11165 [Penicillium brasilianum]|uniref:Uncharacterized protein n=1 Tax=Penicillium brasilianum TaxID=104259 RepID=A0A0F7U350_PENBI|nr:hypothetical protein PMG11_11165 [Penicillium brasilianum]
MVATEYEDGGIRVDDIANNNAKLEEKATQETGEVVYIDKEDTTVRELLSSEIVRAVLLRKQSQPGCVRVEPDEKEANEKPSKYTLTEKLDGTVLVAAKQKESIILLGNITVRCFRRRP